MRGSDYNYGIKEGVIWIIDLNLGNKSVTNDMEQVLDTIDIAFYGIVHDCKIVYRDSEGIWDGVTDGEEHTPIFYGIGAKTLDEAIEFVKKNPTL